MPRFDGAYEVYETPTEPTLVDTYDSQFESIKDNLNEVSEPDFYIAELRKLSNDLRHLGRKYLSPKERQKCQTLLAKINQRLIGHVVKESMRSVKPFLIVFGSGIVGGSVGGTLGIEGSLGFICCKDHRAITFSTW